MMTDPIADMFTRIRNGANAKLDSVSVPHSRIKEQIAKLFLEEGFINGSEVAGKGSKKVLVITIKHDEKRKPVFSEIKRISKLGRRVYISKDEIEPVRYGRGIAIISTSKGIMKDTDARKKGIGGELIANIW